MIKNSLLPYAMMTLSFIIVVYHKTLPILSFLPKVNLFGFGLFSIAPFVFLFGFYLHRRNNALEVIPPSARRPIVAIYLAVVFMLTVYGYSIGNLPINVVYDCWIFLVVLVFIIASVDSTWWPYLYRPVCVVFWLSFILVCQGLGRIREDLHLHGYRLSDFGDKTVASLAYEISPVLDTWPLLFVYGMFSKEKQSWKLLGVASIVAYIALQLQFEKRAPLARAICYLVFALIVLSKYGTTLKTRVQARRMFQFVVIAIVTLPFFIQISGVKERLSSSLNDSSRFDEGMIMLEQLNFYELLIGRGMGGYYEYGRAGLDMGIKVVGADGQIGKEVLHIGWLTVLLKGGAVLVFLIMCLAFPVLNRGRDRVWLSEPINVTAFIVLPVYLLFRFIEGWQSTGHIFDAVMFGFCVGRVLSHEVRNLATPPSTNRQMFSTW